MIFLVTLLLLDIIDLKSPDIFINGDLDFDGNFISYPQDAIFWNNKLYIAAGAHEILIFQGEDFYKKLGQEGEGPGQFNFIPVQLMVKNDQLEVLESFGYNYNYFNNKHKFITKKIFKRPISYKYGPFTSNLTRLIDNDNYMLRDVERKCNILKKEGPSDLDFHLSSFLAFDHNDGILFIKKSGFAELYNFKCELVKRWVIKTGHLAREPIPDPQLTGIANAYFKSMSLKRKSIKYYKYGTPITSVSFSENRLWLLINNEHTIDQRGQPTETWLYFLNIKTNEHKIQKLKTTASHIRYSDGFLILISKENATIKAWYID